MERYIEIKNINVGLLSTNSKRINHMSFMDNISSAFGLSGFENDFEEKREFTYRAMAFNIGNNGLTDDLLFTSPNPYKIEGVDPIETPKFQNIKIKSYYNLSELLLKLDYKSTITRNELEDLMKSITSDPNWLFDIAIAFGFARNESGFYYPDKEVELPQEGFRVLRDISYMGSYIPCVREPDYHKIKKIR